MYINRNKHRYTTTTTTEDIKLSPTPSSYHHRYTRAANTSASSTQSRKQSRARARAHVSMTLSKPQAFWVLLFHACSALFVNGPSQLGNVNPSVGESGQAGVTMWPNAVQCCFTSTEIARAIRAQDGHLHFHTAPELCSVLLYVHRDRTDY